MKPMISSVWRRLLRDSSFDSACFRAGLSMTKSPSSRSRLWA
jgi:hypothetical protein